MATSTALPRAFAVWWKDFSYWQVRALGLALTNRSNWPTVRLGEIAKIRSEIIPDEQIQDGTVNLLDRISFDEGKVFSGKRTTTQMTMFRARPGDIIVSKINARKRAIGIVRDGNNVGVTIHFRALIPDTTKTNTEFLWLALRSTYCTQQFEVETGGIGKGEISEERLLQIAIPLPPLVEQESIVAHWRKAQAEIATARARVKKYAVAISARFFADLGLTSPDQLTMPKAFAVGWKDFSRWGVGFNFLNQSGADLSRGKYPLVKLGDVIADLRNGWSPKCLDRSATVDEWGVLKLGAISFGEFDETANKALPLQFKARPEYEVKAGDVLISRGNVLNLVGAAVYVRAARKRLMLPDLVFRVIWKEDSPIDGAFLAEMLRTTILRQQIESVATGTSPTMKKVTKPALLNLTFPLPPMAVQKQIMERVAAGRLDIARERKESVNLSLRINAEIEALILGTKSLKDA